MGASTPEAKRHPSQQQHPPLGVRLDNLPDTHQLCRMKKPTLANFNLSRRTSGQLRLRLLYHDPDCLGNASPFDEAILGIARAENVCLACPYIGLAYLRRVIRLTESWRLLTDVQEWLRSQDNTQREGIYQFLAHNRFLIRHSPRLHAKVVIGSRSAMVGSANLTDAGIRQRTELAVRLDGSPQVQELTKWFEAHWTRAYELDRACLKRIAAFMKSLPKARVVEDTPYPAISPLLPARLARLVPLPAARTSPKNGSREEDVYVNFGHEEGWREWEDARKYNFICAGGARRYSAPLATLTPGSRVWVYAPKCGYVGVARVTGPVEPASRFQVKTYDGKVRPIMKVLKSPDGYHSEHIKNPERCEYFVPVRWLETKPVKEAVKGRDLFANEQTVCRPTTPIWRFTLRRLRREFPEHNQ
jgi:hypothetical protein